MYEWLFYTDVTLGVIPITYDSQHDYMGKIIKKRECVFNSKLIINLDTEITLTNLHYISNQILSSFLEQTSPPYSHDILFMPKIYFIDDNKISKLSFGEYTIKEIYSDNTEKDVILFTYSTLNQIPIEEHKTIQRRLMNKYQYNLMEVFYRQYPNLKFIDSFTVWQKHLIRKYINKWSRKEFAPDGRVTKRLVSNYEKSVNGLKDHN